MLKESKKRIILESISSHDAFTPDDFSVSFNDSPKVRIKFKHEGDYTFEVYFNDESNSPYVTTSRPALWFGETKSTTVCRYEIHVCPGTDLNNEIWYMKTLDDIGIKIRSWMKNLDSELAFLCTESMNSKYDDSDNYEHKIKEILSIYLESYVTDREKGFDSQEIADISEKLNALIVKFEEANILLEEDLRRLTVAVNNIENNLTRFNQGTWLETTVNRLSLWANGIDSISKIISVIKPLIPF